MIHPHQDFTNDRPANEIFAHLSQGGKFAGVRSFTISCLLFPTDLMDRVLSEDSSVARQEPGDIPAGSADFQPLISRPVQSFPNQNPGVVAAPVLSWNPGMGEINPISMEFIVKNRHCISHGYYKSLLIR
jgi:hypothetical protein